MAYSEELIADLMQQWKYQGYTDIIFIDHRLLYAVNERKYFTIAKMKEDNRVNIYDEHLPGSVWSIHAITLDNSCKGILVLGGKQYNPQ